MLKVKVQRYWHDDVIIEGSLDSLRVLCTCLREALEKHVSRNTIIKNEKAVKINIVVDNSHPNSERWRKAKLPYTDDYIFKRELSPEEHCKLVEQGDIQPLNRLFTFFYIFLLLYETERLNIHKNVKEEYDEIWVIGNEIGIKVLYSCVDKLLSEGSLKEVTSCTASDSEGYDLVIQVFKEKIIS